MEKINCHIIYVLKLEDNCWYVGWTTSFSFKKRMKDHWGSDSKGAMWTRAHKPIRVVSVDTYPRELTDSEIGRIEDKTTLKYAQLYGFDVVRGGGYCQTNPVWPIILTKKQQKQIRRKKLGLSNKEMRAVLRAERELKASAKALR